MSRKKITLKCFFMVFLFEMENKIEKNFCKCLNKWYETHFKGRKTEFSEKGTKTDFGKWLNVSQGQISNVLRGARWGDEAWRRFVAAKIGMDYDTMIGIEKPEKQNITYFESQEDKQHFDVTKQFGNKNLAIEINQTMVRIEKKDPQRLYEIRRFVNHLFDEIEMTKPPEKKRG